MSQRLRQMALPFDPPPRFDAADLIEAPSNAEARMWLDQPATWPLGRLALWGPAGCGKTHLLHIWAERHRADIVRGGEIDPELVPDLPTAPLAIDDAAQAPELALLRLLNTAAEAGQPVLLADRAPPGRWNVALPDLASRLRAITTAPIGAAEDMLLRQLLGRLLFERRLQVTPQVQDYLLLHLPRTPAVLRLAAARLDRAAYSARGAITRALATMALADLLAASDDDIPVAADMVVSPDTDRIV